MTDFITVKNKENSLEEIATLVVLDSRNIEDIMKLQQEVMEILEDKTLYAPSTSEEFLETFAIGGKMLGYRIKETGELIAYGLLGNPGIRESNYGNDVGLEREELPSVAHIESTIVKGKYRGNKLQKVICENLEELAKRDGFKVLFATAAPDNPYSVNTFLNLNYEIRKEKLKYGGLRRYVLSKDL